MGNDHVDGRGQVIAGERSGDRVEELAVGRMSDVQRVPMVNVAVRSFFEVVEDVVLQ